eukprot:Ihof_evm1s639 gene=Ihof_evmTU1s639
MLACMLLVKNHQQNQGHCHTLSVFFLVTVVCYLPNMVSVTGDLGKSCSNWQHCIHVYTTLVSYICCALVALLSLVAEPRAPYKLLDNDEDEDVYPCPEKEAGFLSRVTFQWMSDLMYEGYNNPIRQSDLWDLNKDIRSEEISKQFNHQWHKELKKKRPSVVMAITKAFGGPYLVAAGFKIVSDLLTFISPQLLKMLILFAKDSSAPVSHGYSLAIALFAVVTLQTLFLNQYYHLCFQTGIRVRTAVATSVYQKSLRLSSGARKESTLGEITNLMSVDAQRFLNVTGYLQTLWSAPLQICLALYFLYETMGPSIFAGLGVMLLMIPINFITTTIIAKKEQKLMDARDERMVSVNEALGGIKIIKLYAWEKSFMSRLIDTRKKELTILSFLQYLEADQQTLFLTHTFITLSGGLPGLGLSVTWLSTPVLVALVTFTTYVLQGNTLTAEKAFVALALFNILQFPMFMLPMLVSSMVEVLVSLRRVARFLLAEEIEQHAITQTTNKEDCINGQWGDVMISNGTFQWDHSLPPVLHNINLSLPGASLTAVVGRVGSGKSSLCTAILGCLAKVQGHVIVNGRFAYVAQQAWIQNATVRDNILLGEPYDEERYNRVVEACTLTPDLLLLPAGDLTEIGEKGINLSGGQKQRIAIARAVYNMNADIYILDDPLSAVDPQVANKIFDNVIGPQGLLKNKTRLLVTHMIDCLPRCDRVVVMKGGTITEQGTCDSLKRARGSFSAFCDEYMNSPHPEETQLRRLDGVSRSPIFNHFSETLNGIPTIRAFDMQSRFARENELRVDCNTMSYYATIASNRWLSVRLETVSGFMTLFSALFGVMAHGSIEPAMVGLSVSYALAITQDFNWVVRMTSDLETNIVAVERVEEYTNVEQEAPAIVQTYRPPTDWPTHGHVEFKDYGLRYRPGLDLVLKKISFDIKPMEKVGIVGRTGAGKSSLTLALFRLVEAAMGSILIDGVDISKLGLDDLRPHLTIIPQDPLLFSGTLRSNLDPFNEYDDMALWNVLRHCHL